MKREILFRAKRIDNNEWIEGSFVKTFYNSFIIPMNDETVRAMEIVPVYEDSVCQFTGFHDRNEKKIFENDILDYIEGFISEARYKIYFDKVNGYWSDVRDDGDSETGYNGFGFVSDCKIIGNYIDNPELFDGED